MSAARESIVVAGAGGHAKSVIEVLLEQERWQVIGCTSADGEGPPVLGAPVVGSDDDLGSLYQSGVRLGFVALGDNERRRSVTELLCRIGFGFVTAVSSAAAVAPQSEIRPGSIVMPGAVVRAGAAIGSGVIINTCASVDHDAAIDDFVHLAPGVRVGGGVRVGKGAFVGVGGCIAPDVGIGAGSVIGAGSLVLDDIPDRVVAFGTPARVVRRLDDQA